MDKIKKIVLSGLLLLFQISPALIFVVWTRYVQSVFGIWIIFTLVVVTISMAIREGYKEEFCRLVYVFQIIILVVDLIILGLGIFVGCMILYF